MPISRNKLTIVLIISLMAVLLLSSCGSSGVFAPKDTPTPTATPVPPTPTAVPGEIVWVNATGSANDSLSGIINDFAAQNSLQVRSLTALSNSDITAGTKIVVVSGTGVDTSSLASTFPKVQFVLLGGSNSGSQTNVSTINSNPNDEAFMAGYLTELIAWDWRGAGLVTGADAAGYADSFENGGRFLCGTCAPYYAPITMFPLFAFETDGSPASLWLNDANNMSQYWLSVVYISPSAVSPDVIAALASRTYTDAVTFISTTAAPQDGSVKWAALLDADYATPLKDMLPKLLTGQGGLSADAQITLTSVDTTVISQARLDLFNKTAAELSSGQVSSESVQ